MANQTASKQEIEGVRDLFGLAHDLIAQATFPGHVAGKVQETLKFLAWQHNDFKARAEAMAKVEVVSDKPAIAVETKTVDAAELASAGNAGSNQSVSA